MKERTTDAVVHSLSHPHPLTYFGAGLFLGLVTTGLPLLFLLFR